MIWLIISLVFLLVSWGALTLNESKWHDYFLLSYLISLFMWLLSQVNIFGLGRDEEGLIGWFAMGLLLLIAEKTMRLFGTKAKRLRSGLVALAAFAYAMSFDVFRPDAYARIPAGILILLISLVALKAVLTMRTGGDAGKQIAIILGTFAFALMLYGSFYKLLDRSWLLPWSYMVAIGALFFVLARLWQAWQDLGLGGEKWQGRISAAFGLGQILIVVGAYYHYSQYL